MAETRKKSPRAPSLSLDDALERAIKVYDKERTHSAPTDVVAQHIGYKNANNGAALQAVASLRYFGLLERPQDGMLAVTRDIEAYKFAPSESLRVSLLRKFVLQPAVFADLLEKFQGGLPSDANLKFELIQRGFSPDSAQATAAVFRRSVEFSDFFGASVGSEESSDHEGARDQLLSGASKQIDADVAAKSVPSKDLKTIVSDDSEADRIPVRLAGSRKAWLIIPSVFYERDKERIKAQVDLLLATDED